MKINKNENIEQMLTPRCEFRASDSLKDRIMNAAAKKNVMEMPKRRRPIMRWLSTGVAAAIIIVVVVLAALPSTPAYAAAAPFRIAAEQFDKTLSFKATIKVRTQPIQPFGYVGLEQDFVNHKMVVQSSTGRWSLDKGGRIAVCDGQNTWLWTPETGNGWKIDPSSGSIDFFGMLLNPIKMLKHEENLANENPDVIVEKIQKDGIISLTVWSPTTIDFYYDFAKNKSIETNGVKREYTFDANSGRLLGAKIIASESGITIIEMTDIDYSPTINDSDFAVPANIDWVDMTTMERAKKVAAAPMAEFANITPEEAVKKMFEAMSVWDEYKLSAVMMQYGSFFDKMRGRYQGCKLIEVSDAVKSGNYCGVYVPCRVKFADGSEKDILVAMRKDNPQKAWIADGGL